MNRQKISVIIPIYKTEKFLRKCIESVLNQTHTELEVILVDDGSPDRCGKICDEYAAKDSRIKVIHQQNSGVSVARNEGMKHATGEWVGFVDSDDYIDPEMYDYLLSLTDGDVDFAQCGIVGENANTQWLDPLPEDTVIWNGGYDTIPKKELQFWSNINCNKLYRRSLLEGLSFSPEYTLGEDLLFNAYVIKKFDKAVLGTKALYHYVQRENSACHSTVTEEQLMTYFNALRAAMSLFHEKEVPYGIYLYEAFDICTHTCSMLARGVLKDQTIKDNMRRYAKQNFRRALFSDIKTSTKLKLFLIAYSWRIYCTLLLWVKGRSKVNEKA